MNYLLYTIVNNAFILLQLIIMVRIFLSWIPHDPYNQFIRIIYSIADSILTPIRDAVPIQGMGFDFSPIIAFFLLGFLKKIVLLAI